MKKNVKSYAALSLIWAQAALAGAGLYTGGTANDTSENTIDKTDSSFTIHLPANDTALSRNLIIKYPDTKVFPLQAPDNGPADIIVSTKGGQSVTKLLEEFETAASIESACLAGSIDELVSKLAKEENISKSDAAIRIVGALSNEQIRNLPTLAKTELLESISATDQNNYRNYKHFYALKKIYTNTDEDTSFAVWDAERQVELSKSLRDDPMLIDARKNWDTMDEAQKLDVLHHVVDLTIETYGADIGAKSVPLNYIDHQNPGIYGLYYPGTREMYLNRVAAAIPENFSQTVIVTVHEAVHAYHHQLLDKVSNSTLDENHPAYRYAHILKGSYDRYINNNFDYTAYRSNPTERHAWEIEYIGAYIGTGPSSAITKAEESLKAAQELRKNHKEERQKTLKDARKNDLSCGPTKLQVRAQ